MKDEINNSVFKCLKTYSTFWSDLLIEHQKTHSEVQSKVYGYHCSVTRVTIADMIKYVDYKTFCLFWHAI